MTSKKQYIARCEKLEAIQGELLAEIRELKKENSELQFRNESLWIEVKKLSRSEDQYFEAGCVLAKAVLRYKRENVRLKARLSVFSQKGDMQDAVQNG